MNKKTDKANLEKSKGLFFATGFAVVLLLFVIIIEHKVPVNKSSKKYTFMGEPEFMESLIIIDDELEIPSPKNLSDNNLNELHLNSDSLKNIKKMSAKKISYNDDFNGEKSQNNTVYEYSKAFFPKGNEALDKYFTTQLQYPKEAKERKIQGRVYISFTITKNGAVKNARVVKSSHQLLNAEALRLINHMPQWQTAVINGKPTASKHRLSIVFKL